MKRQNSLAGIAALLTPLLVASISNAGDTWVLGLLNSLPVFHEDRTLPDAKRAQLEMLASAIDEAADTARGWPGDRRDLKALLVVLANAETRFSLRIHGGECHPLECDHGLARGPWQMHASATSSQAAWEQLAGITPENTRVAAREAARAIVRARVMCRSKERAGSDWPSLTIAAFAGRGCGGWFRGLDTRVAMFRRLRARAGA